MADPLPDFLDRDRPPVPDIVVPQGVQPFHLPGRPVRGRLIRLGPLAEALLSRHDHPPPVTRLVGEALALTAGLATALKFRGSFSVQAKGSGAVSLLVADCTDDGQLRGHAGIHPGRLEELLSVEPDPPAGALLGEGYIAFTCDQGPDMDRYQGIVALQGATLADMTHHYFATSEQLQAEVRLACARGSQGWRAGALIIERIAGQGGIGELDEEEQEEAWRTARTLAATLTDAELLDDALPGPRLLQLLFGTEGVALDRARALSYGCRCSRAKLAAILGGFSDGELDEMADAAGHITVTCAFCNHDFIFSRTEIRRG
ncbi:MAG: Hsp33 family molecular chaperone HslO [Rhodovarius sp.]|nr:Hsp33 family molecular chaperone HslO [Rhodovarius sp.]MCX7932836.1 Hsp33 family molecular chaperone HslO [Rhodovarius sp.]MDW8313771.1 Hsp33 family molecular chaperone HslO [Rhodovarius sp.]